MCALCEPFRAAGRGLIFLVILIKRLAALHPGSGNGYSTPPPRRVAWPLTPVLAATYRVIRSLKHWKGGKLDMDDTERDADCLSTPLLYLVRSPHGPIAIRQIGERAAVALLALTSCLPYLLLDATLLSGTLPSAMRSAPLLASQASSNPPLPSIQFISRLQRTVTLQNLRVVRKGRRHAPPT